MKAALPRSARGRGEMVWKALRARKLDEPSLLHNAPDCKNSQKSKFNERKQTNKK